MMKLAIKLLITLVLVVPVTSSWAQNSDNDISFTKTMQVIEAPLGKSTVIKMPNSIERIAVGNPLLADVMLLNKRELYILGKKVGVTNLLLWTKSGQTAVIDISVSLDASMIQEKIRLMMPEETDIQVSAAADSVILSGRVSNAMNVKKAVSIAEAYVRNIGISMMLPITLDDGSGSKEKIKASSKADNTFTRTTSKSKDVDIGVSGVINLLEVEESQQVMLEVKVAEISKTLLNKFGLTGTGSTLDTDGTIEEVRASVDIGSGIYLGSNPNGIDIKQIQMEAQKQDGLVKILAEPNLIAISGQEASFLAGGKFFIPVSSDTDSGQIKTTLEEKEYGVGVKFTPTVLANGLVNLKVHPEVSELSLAGSPFTSVNGVTTVLPSLTTRRASTTVQLYDGQSFAIAGLVKSNIKEVIKRVPLLGHIPILGALFRSSEFENDETELLFIVTPRLVQPINGEFLLPTDSFEHPDSWDFFGKGKLEGDKPQKTEEKNSSSKSD